METRKIGNLKNTRKWVFFFLFDPPILALLFL